MITLFNAFFSSIVYFISFFWLTNKWLAKNHYFAKGISLDSKKECFVTNVRETDFEVLIQESFLRNVKRNSVYEVTLSVADPGRGLGPPAPPYFQTKPKNVFLFWDRASHLSHGLDYRPPPPPPPLLPHPLSEGSGSTAVYYGTFSSIQWGFWPFTWIKSIMVSRQTVHSFKMLRLTFANRAAFCSFQNYLNVITNAVPVLCKFKEIL